MADRPIAKHKYRLRTHIMHKPLCNRFKPFEPFERITIFFSAGEGEAPKDLSLVTKQGLIT
jgi:hypothetical protein